MKKLLIIIGVTILFSGCATTQQREDYIKHSINDDPQTIPLVIWEF